MSGIKYLTLYVKNSMSDFDVVNASHPFQPVKRYFKCGLTTEASKEVGMKDNQEAPSSS